MDWQSRKVHAVCALVGINLLYACTGICTKMAALSEPFSWSYVAWFAGAVAIIGVYALLWQQVLRRIELSTAYMFKGTTLIFTMLLPHSSSASPSPYPTLWARSSSSPV